MTKSGDAARDTALPAPDTLREYAVIGDGERGALISPRGDIALLCFPSWESDAVFGGLLGGAGIYSVRPAESWWVWGGYYEDRSLIWRSRWVTSTGIIECREALARPTSRDRAVLLRQIRAVRGTAHVSVRLDLRAGFGSHRMSGLTRENGVWSARSGRVRMHWHGAEAASGDGDLTMELKLAEGESHDLVLELATANTDPSPTDATAADLWATTETDWRTCVPSCENTLAPRDAQLAYAVLTGLTSACGGMVAAMTTSLPERVGDNRNYDYRYAWIRDQCFAGMAVAAHGGRPELLDASVGFVAERLLADGDRLQPAYTVTGGAVPKVNDVDLRGYPGADVVIGNRVTGQFQLDVFGEALQLFAAAARADRLPREAERATRIAVKAIRDHRDRPDSGIWETEPRRWTHSRLASVAGLRAAASDLAASAELGEWLGLADSILSDTTQSSLSPSGYWRRAPDDDRLDASLLIPALRGALPPDDPRSLATLKAVQQRLVQEGFVYRYQVDDRPLGEAEGAFMLCGFLLALAEHHHGEKVRARARFERLRSGCSTTGLFTEEYDIRQRQLRGNLPQAFVHALLLECATSLGTSDSI